MAGRFPLTSTRRLPWLGGCFIGVDHSGIPGSRIGSDGLGQETLRCGHVPIRREVKLQGLATGGDRPIEVAPPAADPDIGLIHPPGTSLPVRYLPVPPCLLVQLRGVFLDPAVDPGVINRHAPLKSSFPPERGSSPRSGSTTHCPQNNVTGK